MQELTPYIVHSVDEWLPQTQNWMWRQMRELAQAFPTVVVADRLSTSPSPAPMTFTREEWLQSKRNYVEWRLHQKLLGRDLFRRRILRDLGQPVIIFSHFGTRGVADRKLRPHLHIVRYYGFDLERILYEQPQLQQLYPKLFAEADAFVVEGPAMAQQLKELGCPQGKVHILNLATDAEADWKVRELDGELQVLIPARWTEKKGITYGLQALGELKLEQRLPQFKIHLTAEENPATGSQQEYVESIRSLIAELDLEQNVTLHGLLPLEGLQALALKCQFALHPSITSSTGDTEGGFPVVLLDLMNTGLPFITSRHADIPEAVTPEVGILCEERSVPELKQAVLQMLQPGKLEQLSRASRERVQAHFTWAKQGERMREWMQTLWEERPAR